MGVGFGILDNRGYYLALFLLFLACSSPAGLPVSENQTELKRVTLNALFEIQTSAGKTTRLSVWSWDPTSKNFSGYAFYSHVANSYHFKVSGGLE